VAAGEVAMDFKTIADFRKEPVLRKDSPGVIQFNAAGIWPSQLRVVTKGKNTTCGVSVFSIFLPYEVVTA
jgi:hypothetical protein